MTCRVCGGLSPVDMPCYRCLISLIEMYGKYTPPEIRHNATRELFETTDRANGIVKEDPGSW